MREMFPCRTTLVPCAAVLGAFLSLPAPATSQDYAGVGFYVGGGVLGGHYTKIDDETEDALEALGYSADIDTDTALGFELYGGFRLHPNAALEAEFEMLPEADVELDGFGTIAELETWTLTGNVKVFVLTGRVQPHLLVGAGIMDAEVEDTVGAGVDESETDFAVRAGGGLDFYLTEHVAVSAGVDYVIPTGDLEDLDYVSFGGGLQYRF